MRRLVPPMLMIIARIVVACLLTLGMTASNATPTTFRILYSGASYGNTATGDARVTIDDSLFLQVTSLSNVTSSVATVSAFTITISGARSGNGTFGLDDVTNWVIMTRARLDIGKDLIAQFGLTDFNWCSVSFVGCTAPAPGGVYPLAIATNAETGDPLFMTSMIRLNTVPEPGTLALVGLVLLGSWARIGRPSSRR